MIMTSSKPSQKTTGSQTLKTYSKRVSIKKDEDISKKRRADEAKLDAPTPPTKIFARSSIQNYFKPVSRLTPTCGKSALGTENGRSKEDGKEKVLGEEKSLGALEGGKGVGSEREKGSERMVLKSIEEGDAALNFSRRSSITAVPEEDDVLLGDTIYVQQPSSSQPTSPRLSSAAPIFSSDLVPDTDSSSPTAPSSPPLETRKCQSKPAGKKPRRRLTTRPKFTSLIIPSLSDLGSDEVNPNDDTGMEENNTSPSTTPTPQPASTLTSPTLSTHFPLKPTKYTQMQIDLSGTTPLIDCPTCRMEYNPTHPSDSSNHERYHKTFLAGLSLPRNFESVQIHYEIIDGAEHRILCPDHKASWAMKASFEEIFRRTYRDLGGLDVGDLWEMVRSPRDGTDRNLVRRYGLYVYFVGREAVSVVLVERSGSAGGYCEKVSSQEDDGQPDSEVEKRVDRDRKFDVYMMVDRIWTLTQHRRKGYATKLVDIARETFINGLELFKRDISFSPPTKMGREFATKYCQGVFKDENFEFLVDPRDTDGGNLGER